MPTSGTGKSQLPRGNGDSWHFGSVFAEFAAGIRAMVDVDVSKHSGNVRKIDIPLPERGLTQIDSFASKHRETRSSVLAHAARELVGAHAKP
jgi:hypothetical protein